MKKARIMLSAIAVFAIVGGAFAFKAHKSLTVFPLQPTGHCTVAVVGDLDPAAALIYYNTVSSADCPFVGRYLLVE